MATNKNDNRVFTLYKITNKIDGKVYIGQTIQLLKNRWKDHCRKDSKCVYLARSIQKHGKENFTIEMLQTTEDAQSADRLERELIASHKSNDRDFGYNLTAGGNGGALGRVVSQETKDKQSASMKRYWEYLPADVKAKKEEACRQMAQVGRKHTPETREKMSRSRTGKPLSTEHKKAIGDANRGKKQAPEIVAERSKRMKEQWASMSDEDRETFAEERRGKKHSKESNEKRAESVRRAHAEKKARGEPWKKVPVSDETRAKLSKAMMGKNVGKKPSQEAKEKMSVSAKQRANTPEGKEHLITAGKKSREKTSA